ncbi:imidazole glycerol phosphate synthase subunit HisH [Sulfurisphaera ohwakuensis]|uniref:Imidazole glycerol phosphate synthase subunit HisH n=1 Tax=Sulfurisphaera ohwakuensis TaxID=69656 RepID=A0A650CI01_SULOH|nr:imidazole glycerol phosphate synthase subunit HisH [Sulfurisphaera ohwakuensis]MBB5252364.1 glutamine amidotransferase [Sulfurisphaera ohwakuensis]QGR17177.1 imidazole glycerol phosphate synthase subunit HisH [Sulfurisphaera ohwakuensis]
MKATLINYGVGNLFSIKAGLERVGFNVKISFLPEGDEDVIVLPGVGAFSAVSSYLNSMKDKFNELRERGVKFLGVCLGMQVMFDEGTEGGLSKGLGWFKGKVDKIYANVKLPHIGWDKLFVNKDSCNLTEGLDGKYVYYVHSYVAYTNDYVAYSEYGIKYPAVVCNDFAVGTQFHPEKSSVTGKIFLRNFYSWVKR